MDEVRPNDRKSTQEKTGKEMIDKERQLKHHVELFNNEFGYDFELVRKSQVKEYMHAALMLKTKIDNVCNAIGALHTWL